MVDAVASSSRSSEVDVARPILAEVAATIADVQVRNRGTVGGNICVNDPTNHFPPLLVALGATITIRERERRAHRLRRRVLPRRLHDRRRRGRAPDADQRPGRGPGAGDGDGRRHARRARDLRRERGRVRRPTAPGASRSAAWRRCPCARRRWRSGSPGRTSTRRPCAPRSRASARRSTRRPTCTPPPTTAAASPRSRSSAPCSQAAERAKG